MARDDFSAPTKRTIAQRSGYVCAYPNCLAPTSGPALDGESAVNIGVAAHICAASENGPRYDPTMTEQERADAENGIWMCANHSTLIDRDDDKYTVDVLRDWKYEAEDRAMKMLGQPRGCAKGSLASVSPASRLGAEQSVLVDGQPIPYVSTFDADDEEEQMTWYVSAFVIQFSIQKRPSLKNAVLDHLVVTVHETKTIPEYQPLMGVYPSEVNLFYVEIDKNNGTIPREFRPTRYYTKQTDSEPEQQHYPQPMVLDDDIPAQIAVRFNSKSSGMFLMSMDAVVTAGDEHETLPIMPPQWTIFEEPEPYEDME
ncbi:hypothetical protein Mal15_21490 [Stieleria maiorica]|uniref:HNH endonuclease n=1 Tax=Stieleria maiorica TaxID=2795974 RepID=A0A5B9MA57_9BACT|nr:hypothetical protein [Stieleria maiorica]QEF98102.1 hypothetical protein Mal15_21490 [Stieleria maiorica]